MEFVNFTIYSALAAFIFVLACIFMYASPKMRKIAEWLILAAIFIQVAYITLLWMHLGRPPMRTLGETRLWYSFFLPVIGYITYRRWRYSWFMLYCVAMSLLFTILNITHPENLDKTLMPALQSPWFIPHVLVYIFCVCLVSGIYSGCS